MSNSTKGFVPIFVLLAASVVVLAAIPVLKMTVTTKLPDNPSVQGVLIAKGDDQGEKSSGSGDSGKNESHDSGSSGGSSSNSSGEGSKPTTTQSSSQQKTKEKKEVETPRIKVETRIKLETEEVEDKEDEVEIEDEVENPEVEQVDVKLATAGGLEVETEGTRSGKHKATSSGIVVANLKIKSGKDKIEFESKGVLAGTNFPLTLDKTTGQLFVNTPSGPRLIRVLPDQASDIAQTAGVQTQIEKIELLESEGNLTFDIKGKKTGILLGLFPISAEVESKIDPSTGQILSVTQPRWLQLLNSLIK